MKNKIKNTSKNVELEFVPIDKEPCETCKNKKEEVVSFPKFTKQEFDYAMSIIEKRNLTREQQEFLVGLNNRALNDNKKLGCGKCFTQVGKNLKNAYQRFYSQD